MLRSARRARLEAHKTATPPLPDARSFVGCEMEGGHIQRNLGWLWFAGFFGLLASANAQTPSPPAAATQFDGKYEFVSQTNVNETFFTTQTEHVRRCLRPPLKTEPLMIANGEARYTSPRGLQFEGNRRFAGRVDNASTCRAFWQMRRLFARN